MLLDLRHPRLWLVAGWVFVALAVVASLMPMERLPQPPGINDKVEHLVAYTLLSLWFAGIYPRSRYVVIGIALFLLGVAIEWAQGTMELGRYADVRDIVANTVGILIGLSMALLRFGGWAQRVEAWTKRS